MPELPWNKWFCADWLSDPCLSRCSPATRGIWKDALDAMILANTGDLRGTKAELARICRCSEGEMEAACRELDDTKTASVVMQNGCIIIGSRRLRRELKIRRLRSKAASSRWSKRDAKGVQDDDAKGHARSASAYASASSSLSEKKKECKKKYGELQKVLLSDDEYGKLVAQHGEAMARSGIEVLDGYIASKNVKYASHYAVMKAGGWVWERVKETGGSAGAPQEKPMTMYEINSAMEAIDKKLAAFTGSQQDDAAARQLRKRKRELTDIQARFGT